MKFARWMTLDGGALAAVGMVWAVFAAAGSGLFRLPRGAFFGLVLLLIVASSLSWWSRVNRGLGRSVGGQYRRWLRVAWVVHLLMVLSPFALALSGARWVWDEYPLPLIVWILSWHMLMVILTSVRVLGAVALASGRRISGLVAKSTAHGDAVDVSRRSLLARGVLAAPLVVTAASVVSGFAQAGRFRVRNLTIQLPRLPENLRGLTITHLSDLHVGRLFRPEHLPAMVDAANKLDSDLVAITGDLVDHSNDFLPAACDAIGQLEARYGRLLVVGNHDLIDEPAELLNYLRRREPHLLIDRTVPFMVGGETIQVTGLFWSHDDTPQGKDPGHVGRATTALERSDPERFTIGLAHHPHAFDALAERGVDLTLAGHTHGGQLMLTPTNRRPALGGGSLMFRYIHGEYWRGKSAMYVNAGVGNWFPVRVNAPAEIVQIRLV